MGKRIIIQSADFSANGMPGAIPFEVLDGYFAQTDGTFKANGDYLPGDNIVYGWSSFKTECESGTYFFSAKENADYRLVIWNESGVFQYAEMISDGAAFNVNIKGFLAINSREIPSYPSGADFGDVSVTREEFSDGVLQKLT